MSQAIEGEGSEPTPEQSLGAISRWCAEERKATNAFVRMTHNMASQEAAASLNLSLLVRIIWNNYSGCIWIGLPLSELLK